MYNISEKELKQADDYFASDLRIESWTKLSEAEKKGALKLAVSDIQALLHKDFTELADDKMLTAIFEQAIFLAEQRMHSYFGKNILSEQIDGAGSVSYESEKRRFSERALAILGVLHPQEIRVVR